MCEKLSVAELLSVADPSLKADDRVKVTSHLEYCEECRQRFISLQTLRVSLSSVSSKKITPVELTSDCVPMDEIGDLLGRRLPEEEREKYSAHVKECDTCFDRAAFFTAETIKMTEGVLEIEKTPKHFLEAVLPRKEAPNKLEIPTFSPLEWFKKLFSSPVPAYALAAALLVAVVMPSQQADHIIDFATDNTFSIYQRPVQSGPSFGFSDAASKISETSANFQIIRGEYGGVTIAWTPIKGAKDYNMTLSEITTDGPDEVFQTNVSVSKAMIPSAYIAPDKLYRYRVSGKAGDRIFVGSGQFGTK